MSTPETTPTPSRGVLFFVLASTLLVVGFSNGSATGQLPALIQDFGVSYALISLVTSAYFFLLIIMLALGGRLRALAGGKPLLLTATAAFVVATVLEGLARDFTIWTIGRLLGGTATGCILAASLGLAADNARRTWRNDAIGVLLALYFLGTALGPSLANPFYDLFGWRDLSFASAALALIALILQIVFAREPSRAEIDSVFD